MRNAKKILAGFVVLVCLSIWIIYEPKEEHSWQTTEGSGAAGLRVFYAGHPEGEREKDFVQFLSKHFKQVGTGDLVKFKEEQAEYFDVVILDYDGDGFKAPRPKLSPEYTRPTMTIGVAGSVICSNMSLKTEYL
jgi:hypothetical protein